jgi:hypothetical protein
MLEGGLQLTRDSHASNSWQWPPHEHPQRIEMVDDRPVLAYAGETKWILVNFFTATGKSAAIEHIWAKDSNLRSSQLHKAAISSGWHCEMSPQHVVDFEQSSILIKMMCFHSCPLGRKIHCFLFPAYQSLGSHTRYTQRRKATQSMCFLGSNRRTQTPLLHV